MSGSHRLQYPSVSQEVVSVLKLGDENKTNQELKELKSIKLLDENTGLHLSDWVRLWFRS